MEHLLARKKPPRSKKSEASSGTPTPSNQMQREAKSTPYRSLEYPLLLRTKGSFMRKSGLGITDISKTNYRTLLETKQTVPEDSLFRDDLFDETCEMIQDRNEAKFIQDITRLIVPSAEPLVIHSTEYLKSLIKSVNKGWDNSITLTKTCL